MYTDEGLKFMDRLWQGTLEELDCQETREVLQVLSDTSAI